MQGLDYKIVTPDTPLGISEVYTGDFNSAKKLCKEMANDHGFSYVENVITFDLLFNWWGDS
tara:strand:- start:163 stop:345 length:183 start_codon:yes stop_codon:yes gene_type:complete